MSNQCSRQNRARRRTEDKIDLQATFGSRRAPFTLTPDRCTLMFEAEDSSVRWFCATARIQAHFDESCQIHDRLRGMGPYLVKAPKPQRPTTFSASGGRFARREGLRTPFRLLTEGRFG